MRGRREAETRAHPCVLTLCLVVFLFALSSCPRAEGAATSADVLSREIRTGKEVSEQIEKHWTRVTDPVLCARLEMILDRLRPTLSRPLPYELRLVDRPEPNAFALPGGICYLTRGMLGFVRSDPELAGVVAHELTHADRRHGMIQMARNERVSLLALAVAVASRGQAAAVLLANLGQMAVMNAYSRDLEREADAGALGMLLQGGYDPVGMVTLLERLQEEQLKHPYVDPGIAQDHPDLTERIRYVEEVLEEKGIRVARKGVLGLLRVRVSREGPEWTIRLDDRPWLRCPEAPGAEAWSARVARRLEEQMQMELAPHEILLVGEGPSRSLRVGGKLLLASGELPPLPTQTLDSLRETLVESLLEAQKKHPMGRFLQ